MLYADDTIGLAENEADMQSALNAVKDYCDLWYLSVNVSKTKVVIFSKGKLRKTPTFSFGSQSIQVVDDYTYLGIIFNYNNKFNKAMANR